MELNTSNPSKTAKDAYNGATKAVDKFADKFADKAQTGIDQVTDRAQALESSFAARYENLKDSAAEGYDMAVDTVKKYPLYAVLGSTAIGLLAGILIARRRD
jgi:ElaB/YqjD/DUF883 family membrane-anchored ribosome-binding protein